MTKFSAMIDKRARPEDDLFLHVNNRWIKRTKIPPERAIWGSFYELREANLQKLNRIAEGLQKKKGIKPGSIEQKVRDFYLSGIHKGRNNKGTIVELNRLFKMVDAASGTKSLSRLIGEMHLRGIDLFWNFYVEPDQKKSSVYALRLTQAGLSLMDRDNYTRRDAKTTKLKQAFQHHAPKMFRLAGVEDPDAGRNLWALEYQIASNSLTSTELRDVKRLYNKMSFTQLRRHVRSIDWLEYFRGLGIKSPKSVIVNQPDFMKFVGNELAHLDVPALKRYIKWHILLRVAPFLGENIARAHFEFFGTKLYGIPKLEPLWKRVISAVDSSIGEALGKLYVDRYFPPAARKRMEVLIENLRTVFADRIKKLDWMLPATKQVALKKLAKTRVKIGHPEKMENYKKLEVLPDSYLTNVLNARVFNNSEHLHRIGGPIDKDWWWMTPPTVNAYFVPEMNEIVFPAGILQPPFFDFKADDAVNYGGIGEVIGHEFTHGFDDQGSLFDGDGNLKNWRGEKDKKAFDKRAAKMKKQAADFEVLPGMKLNGKLTLGENIADLGGAEIAFEALGKALQRESTTKVIDGFNPEQRFFLNLALVEKKKARKKFIHQLLLWDPHSPGDFRVNNTVRNMESFHQTFNLKPGDKLYLPPQHRVKIW